MKKLLIASTALSLAGGAAFAEMAFTLSGDAKMGVDYNSEATGGKSKHEFKHEVGVDFTGSGTTDGGLTFGGSAGFDTNDDMVNLGTVHVSGSFGTLTIGDNDPASLLSGGIADIGLNGIDVDDKVEDLREGTAAQLRYDNNFGQIKIAISAGTATVKGMKTADAKEFNPGKPAVTGVYRYKLPGEEVADEDGKVPDLGFGDLFLAAPTEDGMAGPGSPRVHADDRAAYQEAVVAHVLEMVGAADASDTLEVAGTAINYSHDGSTPAVDMTAYRLGGTGAEPGDDEDSDKLYAIADNSVAPATVTDDHVGAWKALASAYGTAADGGLEADQDAITSAATPEVKTIVMREDYVAATPAVDAVFAPDKSETQYAFGMSFEAGGVTIGVGYDSNKTVSMGAGFSAGEVSTNLLYVKTDDDTTGMGVDMTYTMGASAVTLAYGREKPEEGEATDAVGMGVTHDLGGGATMNAGFGKVDESNKASIGLSFAF